ncbi:MAG: FAD-dependent oxidoreductase [Eubacteriales bacterium]
MKVVIVGGVATGAAAAARLRRLNEEAEIIVLEKTGYVSYANCGLPYYIGNVIKDEHELTLQTPESFKRRFNIDVRVKSEVISIDRQNKCVTVRNLQDGNTYEESYDKLVLAPGATANLLNLKNIDKNKTFSLKTVEDTKELEYYLRTHDVREAVVFGGGFIGVEVAENLRQKGCNVYIAVRNNQILPNFDYDMVLQIEARMRNLGVNILKNLVPEDYEKLAKNADLVVMSVGVTPQIEQAKQAGLEISELGTIAVNEKMQTSDENIYAGGDAVGITNVIFNEKAKISLAGPAAKQGRVIADNICGLNSTYEGANPSSILKVFDITAASTGINEREAVRRGIDADKVIFNSPSHATYYPGATSMFSKVIFEKGTGKLLGAQIVGQEGVDKRIDVLATAIYAKLTVYDLKKLDLAYAPPYSSAKDPVNMAGFIIENVVTGKMKQFFATDVNKLENRDDIVLLDVRTPMEYKFGHFKNSVNIPLDELRSRLLELDKYKGKDVYINCHSGLRSYIALRILQQKGFNCYNLAGGYAFYSYLANDSDYDMAKRRECGLLR